LIGSEKMRESLFEKLKKRELHFLDELIKIKSLLYEQNLNLMFLQTI